MHADWILSNELLAEREGAIYIDYVWDLRSAYGTWMTPARHDSIGLGGPARAVPELVRSFKRTAGLSRRTLDLIAHLWKGFELRDDADRFQYRTSPSTWSTASMTKGLFLDAATQGSHTPLGQGREPTRDPPGLAHPPRRWRRPRGSRRRGSAHHRRASPFRALRAELPASATATTTASCSALTATG